ncbi:hypothetical protein KAR91_56630 [Candidatus Pacearchaeota archaeon]|nr:hypothetical protein [Candidatus Pacearchaeota archaeon]
MAISYSVGRTFASPVRPSGGGTSALQGIIKQMQVAQQKANKANERRYQQILGSFENLGKAGRARIEQQTIQRQAQATQSLTSRGLGGTTITSAVERGIASDAELSRQQLEESVTMQKAGVMERRTDEGPDLGMFASLLQSAGQQRTGGRSVVRQTEPRPEYSEWGFGPRRPSAGTARTRNRASYTPPRSGIRAGERPSAASVRAGFLKGATVFRPGVK